MTCPEIHDGLDVILDDRNTRLFLSGHFLYGTHNYIYDSQKTIRFLATRKQANNSIWYIL